MSSAGPEHATRLGATPPARAEALTRDVEALLHEILPGCRAVGADTLKLDSLELVRVLVAIEGRFEVSFSDQMLSAETFRSARSIADAVTSLVMARD